MEKHVRTFLQSAVIVMTLATYVQAQPAVVTAIPNGSKNFTTVDDLVYFVSGDSLLRTDGTEAGTMELKSGFIQTPNSFVEFNDMLIFKTSANELWRSDGTPAGTIRLITKDAITTLNSTTNFLFFVAQEASAGNELYRTDGTPSGTVLVKDIFPGSGSGYRGPSSVAGNQLFFAGNNGASGTELWKSDGSSAGTVMIKDIQPGAGNGYVSHAFSHDNLFYFTGNTTENGTEPWVSDGTTTGTQLLKDMTPGPETTWGLQFLIGHNESVYFIAFRNHDGGSAVDLWKTSGTTPSTIAVKEIKQYYSNEAYYLPLIYHNKVYFFEDAEIYDHLWVSDGTSAGTYTFFDFPATDGHVNYFDVVNDYLLFTGESSGYPMPLYRSDGTSGGTQEVTTFKSLGYDRGGAHAPVYITSAGGYAFYADHDGPVDEGGYPENEEDYNHLFQTDAFAAQSMRTLYGISTVGTREIVYYQGKVIFTTLNDQESSTDRQAKLWIYDPAKPRSATFTLVNADTDKDIQALNDGDLINKEGNINIRYNPVEAAGSVVFKLSDVVRRIENAPPYALAGDVNGNYSPWQDGNPGSYKLTAIPYSEAGGKGIAGTALTINFTIGNGGPGNCTASGTILREYWANVSGNNVSEIPVDQPPTSTNQLTIFEGPTNIGTNYGTRIRGYICPPVTGNYTFWIASNDHSELWLSTTDQASDKVKIAFIESGATMPREWDKFPSQRSLPITLTAGKRYYIEALHKQGVGTDNVTVGWQIPDGTMERPIPGNRLSPFSGEGNNPPVVSITRPAEGDTFAAFSDITIEANATDGDGAIDKVEYFEGANKVGEDMTAPFTFAWTEVPPGTYSLTAKATDNESAATTSSPVHITVGNECMASGTITREYWSGIQGNRVSDIPLDRTPNSTSELTIFEGPSNIGTNYGTRIRGYLCPPATGSYTFWIASNDHSELWLSTDETPAHKVKIAYIAGATGIREWTKFASQRSAPIQLTQGKKYYVEALHKQGVGTDNIAVGWQLPNGIQERPVPGFRLSPFETSSSATMAASDIEQTSNEEILYSQINIYPNPMERNDRELTIAGYAGVEAVETEIEIINLTGEVVFADRIRCGGDCSSYLISVNKQLVPGLFLVNMTTNGRRNSRRLLVK